MVIINIGMPRSGTLWRYKIVRDLVIAAGGKDGEEIRKRYLLHPFFSDQNAHIDTLSNKRLPISTYPSFLGETYVLNTHAGPKKFVRRQIEKGKIKAIYGYRDPRDCILSILDYSRSTNPYFTASEFRNLNTVEDAAKYMIHYLDIWKAWHSTSEVLIIKYEDQLEDYEQIVKKIVSYLDLTISKNQKQEIILKYLPKQPALDGSQTHFSKGIAQRFRTEFSPDENLYLTRKLGPYLKLLGYPVD